VQHAASGLKVFDAGEWLHEKHGGKPRRSWRRLHLAINPDSSEILAAELTDEGDASLVGPLLDQIDGPVSTVLADGAHDGEPTYRTVLDRHSDAAVVILPRSTAVPSDTADTDPTQRDRHIQRLARKGRRLILGFGVLAEECAGCDHRTHVRWQIMAFFDGVWLLQWPASPISRY
jgi:hypothetical protein